MAHILRPNPTQRQNGTVELGNQVLSHYSFEWDQFWQRQKWVITMNPGKMSKNDLLRCDCVLLIELYDGGLDP